MQAGLTHAQEEPMAADGLNIPFQCPACKSEIQLPTQTGYEPGGMVLRIDTSPVREHIATDHNED